MSANENGLLIIQTKEDGKPIKEDDLHSCVCPVCGNTVFDGKSILVHEDLEDVRTFRCFGGFGYITYHWMPHTCTACYGNFVAWKSEKSVNKEVIMGYIGIILTIIVMAFICVVAITKEVAPLFMLNVIGVVVLGALLCTIHNETLEEDSGLKYILENTEFPEKEEIQEALNPKPKKSKDVPIFPITAECVQAKRDTIEDALRRIEGRIGI